MFEGVSRRKFWVTIGIALGLPLILLLVGAFKVFSQMSLNSSYGRNLFLYAWKPELSVGFTLLGMGVIVATFILLNLKNRFYAINLVTIYFLIISMIAWRDFSDFVVWLPILLVSSVIGWIVLLIFLYPFVSLVIGKYTNRRGFYITSIVILLIYSFIAGISILTNTRTFG
jgi:hypothetical protein